MINSNNLYKKLVYIMWCATYEYSMSSCITHAKYLKYLKDIEFHRGDCTKDPCPCTRCHHIEIEIKAQNALDLLESGDKGWCGDDCIENCQFEIGEDDE